MLEAFRNPGRWLRVNTHAHTTRSDGRYTPEEAVARYRALGYQALAITDHRIATPTEGLVDPDDDFCVIPGSELDGRDPETDLYHLVALGVEEDQTFSRQAPLQEAVDWVNQRGSVAIFAHPYWSGQLPSALIAVEGAVGLEVFNTGCQAERGKGYSLVHWDALLQAGKRVWGVASDDVHFTPENGYGGDGWIMVRADENTPPSILEAIRAGRFYATTGPGILDVQRAGASIYVRCSPVVTIAFTGQRGHGQMYRPAAGQEALTEAEFTIAEETFVRITCTDAAGRAAWSQPLFLDE
jgi:hypothetical protein